MYASMLNCFSHVQLFLTLMTIACQVPLSMVFRRQEYWSGLPCPPLGDHPNPGIEPTSLRYPALVYRFFITSAPLEVLSYVYFITKRKGKNEENTCITAYFALSVSGVIHENMVKTASRESSKQVIYMGFLLKMQYNFHCGLAPNVIYLLL